MNTLNIDISSLSQKHHQQNLFWIFNILIYLLITKKQWMSESFENLKLALCIPYTVINVSVYIHNINAYTNELSIVLIVFLSICVNFFITCIPDCPWISGIIPQKPSCFQPQKKKNGINWEENFFDKIIAFLFCLWVFRVKKNMVFLSYARASPIYC